MDLLHAHTDLEGPALVLGLLLIAAGAWVLWPASHYPPPSNPPPAPPNTAPLPLRLRALEQRELERRALEQRAARRRASPRAHLSCCKGLQVACKGLQGVCKGPASPAQDSSLGLCVDFGLSDSVRLALASPFFAPIHPPPPLPCNAPCAPLAILCARLATHPHPAALPEDKEPSHARNAVCLDGCGPESV